MSADTTYAFLVGLDDTITNGGTVEIGKTSSDAEDSGAAAGWSVADIWLHTDGGEVSRYQSTLRIAIKGYAIDTVKPTLVAGTINESAVTLYFSEDLDETGTAPAGTQFAFAGTTTTDFGTISNVTISGSTITMTTGTASTTTETVTLAISDTTGIQDLSGNALEAVTSITLTNTAAGHPARRY